MPLTATILPPPAKPRPVGSSGVRLGAAFVLVVWFLLITSLGAAGAFVGRPGAPPLAMAAGVVAPLLLFLAWQRFSPSFRDFVLSLDLRLVAGMQAWRWMGVGFLFLYACKVLPAAFALPAGLGDMAIGVTAPWIVLALVRRPGFAASAAFVRWNVLGMLDLVVALGLGAALSMRPPGEVGTASMSTLPLLWVPAFLVPWFLMLHIAALMQGRRTVRAVRSGDTDGIRAALSGP